MINSNDLSPTYSNIKVKKTIFIFGSGCFRDYKELLIIVLNLFDTFNIEPKRFLDGTFGNCPEVLNVILSRILLGEKPLRIELKKDLKKIAKYDRNNRIVNYLKTKDSLSIGFWDGKSGIEKHLIELMRYDKIPLVLYENLNFLNGE